MKIKGQLLTMPFEIKIAGKPIFNKDIKVGKITKSYFKDGKMWVDFSINKSETKAIRKLSKAVSEFLVSVTEVEK